eukprot:246564_1
MGIKKPKSVNIENNIFESGTDNSAIYCANQATINNNTFGSVDHTGLLAVSTCSSPSNVTSNMFINWQWAIHPHTTTTILYNEIRDSTYGIYIGTSGGRAQQINYNNFINNSYSIYYSDCGADTIGSDNCKQPYCGYNYYGTSSINQSIISSQIYDLCVGGDGYGLVTWWPWYTEPIDFNSLPTTLQEHTF